jgi:hypothetical protein
MTVEVSVRFSWRKIGHVELDKQDTLKFPQTTAHPGLYRFDFTGADGNRLYIGETDTLNRRLQHYRTPGPTQTTNIRLNALMHEIIKSGGSVGVSIMTEGATVAMNGGEKPPCLGIKSDRVLLEHAAIYAARESGISLVNV